MVEINKQNEWLIDGRKYFTPILICETSDWTCYANLNGFNKTFIMSWYLKYNVSSYHESKSACKIVVVMQ